MPAIRIPKPRKATCGCYAFCAKIFDDQTEWHVAHTIHCGDRDGRVLSWPEFVDHMAAKTYMATDGARQYPEFLRHFTGEANDSGSVTHVLLRSMYEESDE